MLAYYSEDVQNRKLSQESDGVARRPCNESRRSLSEEKELHSFSSEATPENLNEVKIGVVDAPREKEEN